MIEKILNFLTPSKIFLLSLFGFIFGIYLGNYFYFSYRIFGILFFILLSLLVYFWEEKITKTFLLFSIFFISGLFRYQLALPNKDPTFINFYNGLNLEIKGKIISFPEEKMKTVSFEIGDLKIKNNNIEKDIKGKIFVTTKINEKINYGDVLFLRGFLKEPKNEKDFFQKDILTSKMVFSVLEFPEIKILQKNQGNIFWQKIFLWRQKMKDNFFKSLPAKEACFISALVLGTKKEMPDFIYDLFIKTGTFHLVVVSGFHLIIISEIILKILRPYFGKKSLFLVILFSFIFVILSGANPPVLRAFIFILFLNMAELLGRQRYFPTTLVLAAVILLFLNPFLLRWSLSFQLSFLSTLGIFSLSNFFENLFKKIPQIFSMPLSATLSAQIFILPYMLFNFSNFSLTSFLANILIVFPTQILLILGIIIGFLGLVFPFFNNLLLLALPIFKFIFFILENLSKFPVFSTKGFSFYNFYITVFYYAFLIGFLFFKKNENPRKV